jgi:hypothetical protein
LCPEELVLCEELPTTLADPVELERQVVLPTVLGQKHFLNDAGVDELLEVLANRRLALTRVDVVEFLQRRQFRWMPEDILEEREPRLLGDDVEPLPH